ncbi:metal-dependent transcriptional regulator [Algoriphagus aquimarinus]|uniref:Transcriptional regulator MntR n=1 Tax=Algoriphagus aquimarinus TaxID=237018 RepID=A0A1I0YA00_9BACT|nr:metal-dependent transcriptional regulator [Algoriphagus aquimarinus]SFB09586.1 iron (metal) dependent repressor, DtxR family [Algoriphagus aquimarinus]|tara:strand:+ start:12004 stop:12660 length:657 start_codon:yes stop_codon:yes gene_type:complete
MASQTEENYLKSLFNLANEKDEVNISELASQMQVSMPTVNSMVKTLQKNGWLIYEKYKPVTLTPAGKKDAALVIRKHRLTEMFLVNKMGFGWEEVHEIAEQVEHIHAPKFFERMDEMMGFPTIDPHGSPIPDKLGRIQEINYLSLTECKAGQLVKLAGLTNSSTEFLEFLNGRNLSLGTELRILSKEAYDHSIVVSYSNHTSETLSEKVCEKLLVKVM